MKTFNRCLNVILGLIFGVMLVLVLLQVVNRYLFHLVMPWTEEMSRFLYIWLTFFGAVIVTRDKEHVEVDVLFKKIPPLGRVIINHLNSILIVIFLGVMIYGGWIYTVMGKNAPASTLPILKMGVVVGVVPVSGILILAFYLIRIFLRKEEKE